MLRRIWEKIVDIVYIPVVTWRLIAANFPKARTLGRLALIALACLAIILLLVLTACAAPKSAPAATQTPMQTPYVAQQPYAKPAVAADETLLWYGGGEYCRFSQQNYTIIGFPDEYLDHTDTTHVFDDGPEDARKSTYFSSVLRGKAPLDTGKIVILASDGSPLKAANLHAVVYDVRVDEALHVTLGKPRLCEADLYFERLAGTETYPMNPRNSFASEGGGFHLSDSITDGTPYYQAGIYYDSTMVGMETGGHYDTGADSEAAGSGAAYYRWEFTPLAAGESDIMILTGSHTGDLTGVLVHVIVDEALAWSLPWYAEGDMTLFACYAAVEGIRYQIA